MAGNVNNTEKQNVIADTNIRNNTFGTDKPDLIKGEISKNNVGEGFKRIFGHPVDTVSTGVIDSIFGAFGGSGATEQGQELWKYSRGRNSIQDMSSINPESSGAEEYSSINDIKNSQIRDKVWDKLQKEKGLMNYKDLKGVVFNQKATLSDEISKDAKFIKKVQDIYNNKEKNYDTHSFGFWDNMNLWSSIHSSGVIVDKNIKDGKVTAYVVDLYNYNNDKNRINQAGYAAQQSGLMKPYYVIVPVSIPIDKLNKSK